MKLYNKAGLVVEHKKECSCGGLEWLKLRFNTFLVVVVVLIVSLKFGALECEILMLWFED
jgi:hypothetical protein